jgi:hypothetical protein
MKDRAYFLNTALAAVTGVALLVCVIIRAFSPLWVLPRLDIPNMVLLSLVALLADHYFAAGSKRCWLCILPLAALTFGLLPFAAGFAAGCESLKLGLVGCAAFGATAWLFDSVRERLSSGPVAKAAPILSAFGLYLAAQCFAGIL